MLANVRTRLTQHLQQDVTDEDHQLTRALKFLLAHFELKELIGSALHPDCRDQIAAQSYHHPNGFTKIVLLAFNPSETPFELRLHDWNPNDADAPAEIAPSSAEWIHDHGWSFASYIASGALAFEEFEPSINGEMEFHEFQYVRPGSEVKYLTIPVGITRLQCTRRGIHRKHDVYFFRQGRFHRTWPLGSDPTVSLLMQGPARANSGRIFRDPRQTENPIRPAQRSLSASELEVSISRVLDRLQAHEP